MVVHELTYQPKKILANVRIEGNRTLSVGPQQLLVGRDVTRLHGGSALGLYQDVQLSTALRLQKPPNLAPSLVVADNRDKRRRRSQCAQVAQDVAGTAQRLHFALDTQHRYRRFGRYPGHVAIDVMIQHHVADAQDTSRSQAVDMR